MHIFFEKISLMFTKLPSESGIKWIRRLVLRGKLTMHTAYERRDNACPASVTAVAAARSGRGLAVGDARGRVSVQETSLNLPIDTFAY